MASPSKSHPSPYYPAAYTTEAPGHPPIPSSHFLPRTQATWTQTMVSAICPHEKKSQGGSDRATQSHTAAEKSELYWPSNDTAQQYSLPQVQPTPQPRSDPTVIPAGFHNYYFNCYLNSTLQCLFATPEFFEKLPTHAGQLVSLMRELYRSRTETALFEIGARVMDGFGEQQCAHVLFLNLINKLSDEITGGQLSENHFRSVFGVDVEYQSVCMKKHQISSCSRGISLSLPLPQPDSRFPESYQSVQIEYCFRHFTRAKPLNIDCKTCPNHSNPQPSTHQARITSFPPILVLHFQRSINGSKDPRTVIYPKEILIPGSNQIYEVYAVVYHVGRISAGHYYAKVKIREAWYQADDMHITEIREKQVSGEDAYLMFCRRKSRGNR